jgi:O-antigen ligase
MSAKRGLPIREKVICSLLVLSVTLGSLMNLGGMTTSKRELVLAILLVGAILALPGGRLRTTGGRAVALCAFVGCTVVAYLRFGIAPIAPLSGRVLTGLAVMLIIVTAFALCALLAPADARTRRRRLLCALFSPACFVALNLSLYTVGFHFPTSQSEITTAQSEIKVAPAQLLSLIGIHTTRANLPLSPGFNGTGEAAVLALVICGVLAWRSRAGLRLISVAGVLVGLISVFLTDSRGPLAYGLLALMILLFLPRWAKRVVALVPVLLPIAPAAILFVVGHLGSLSEALNRNSSKGSFETATGRSEIWSIVVKFLSHPHIEDLIGYGAYGQVRSGVGFQYAYLFSSSQHPEFTSVHNIALQTILDMGYIGLVLFLAFLVVAVNSARLAYQNTGTPESAALLVALIALSLFGASEALPGLAGVYLLVAVIVLACAAIRVYPPSRLKVKSLDHAVAPYLRATAPGVPARSPHAVAG